jgi:serine/threonine-protein kinase
MIAVLPFASTGADPNTEYLSDGLSEQLINSLSQLPQLRVIARTTAFTYKGKPIDLAKVGKELRVRSVLTGKVVERGDSLIVQVDLVSTEDGSELWGQQFNRKSSELQTVEEEIARQVSNKLRVRLSGEEQGRLAKRYTENPEAYNLYLQGRFLLDDVAPEAVVKSRAYFEKAIAKDPNYALAHAGLADSYTYAWINGIEPPDKTIPKAREEALRAIQTDSSVGEGHISNGGRIPALALPSLLSAAAQTLKSRSDALLAQDDRALGRFGFSDARVSDGHAWRAAGWRRPRSLRSVA